jgi:hypothetical protein
MQVQFLPSIRQELPQLCTFESGIRSQSCCGISAQYRDDDTVSVLEARALEQSSFWGAA